jgi:hypothetical protein
MPVTSPAVRDMTSPISPCHLGLLNNSEKTAQVREDISRVFIVDQQLQ